MLETIYVMFESNCSKSPKYFMHETLQLISKEKSQRKVKPSILKEVATVLL